MQLWGMVERCSLLGLFFEEAAFAWYTSTPRYVPQPLCKLQNALLTWMCIINVTPALTLAGLGRQGKERKEEKATVPNNQDFV